MSDEMLIEVVRKIVANPPYHNCRGPRCPLCMELPAALEDAAEGNRFAGKTANEWHDIAVTWKTRALNAEMERDVAQRDADLLANRLLEEAEVPDA
jgi:hypothetical protein